MRKIYTVFLLSALFAMHWQTAIASGNEKKPGRKDTNNPSPLACPIPGTYTIGPTGNYASITAAIAELASCPSLTGAYIFELESAYVSIVETFPITIPNFIGSSAGNTITFRPEAAATALSITSNNTTGTILFNGGDFILFDGRPGGIGTAKELTIQNTNVGNSYAIRFINDATDNTVHYCTVRSANNNAGGATIIIGGTGGVSGNDNITIDNNDIREVSAVITPNNAILSAGATATATMYNNNIVISNNNILNFYNATGNIAGILATQGSSNWVITGNNFNHTFGGTTKPISGSFSAINAVNTQMEDFTITNNYFGGTSALPSGANINLNGTGTMHLIRLGLNTSVTNTVQGNTVWNIIYNSIISSPLHSIINLDDGSYNFNSNTIGSTTSTGNISLSFNSNGATNNFAIINCGTGSTGMGAVNISNSFIGNIDMAGTSSTCNFQLINFSGNTGTYTINNNTLGSAINNPSVNLFLNTVFTAINGNMSVNNHSIVNNIITNMWQPSLGANGILYGIRVQGNAGYTINDNTITGFRNSSTNTANYSLVGISNTATVGGQIISGNKMSVFSTASSAVRTGIAGIYYSGPASGTNVIEKNFIHTFNSSSTVTSTSLVGIHAATGTCTYKNNMVRLGINSSGGFVSTAYDIQGIYEEGGTNDFYFNSVYIGGNSVSAGSPSCAFNSAINANVTRNYKNNIFYNARSNLSASTPYHYAIKAGSNTGVSSDYNVLLATGTGKMIANYAGTDLTTLALWRTNIGGDVNSYSVDPQFIAPAGTSTTVDLHIKPSPTATIVEANGFNIGSVTDDYDVQTRATLTPTDIGADAGIFTAVTKADMGAVNMINPASFACYNSTAQIKVVIKNFYTGTINFTTAPVTILVAVSGAITTNLSTTINTGSLAAGDTLVVTMPGALNMSTVGTYNFSVGTTIGGIYTDVDITNNIYTTSVTPSTYNIGTLNSSVSNFCNSGIPVLTLTGTAGTVQWQQSTISNTGPWTNVGSNSLTYVPLTVSATTYYQAVVSCGASTGPSNVETVLVIPASVANTAALADGAPVLSICNGSSITLTQTGGSLVSGAEWQWYEGTPANNFITPVGSSTTTADAATTITPTINATYYLRASGGTAPCDGPLPASNTGNPVATVIVNPVGTWLGGNANWNDGTNWCGGAVPTAATDAYIPTGLSIYPVVSTIQSVRNIAINSGASVTLSAVGELTIKGNYSNTNGTIANNGKIILNGTALQAFPGSTATVAAMNKLETDNAAGVSIDNSFTISGKLEPTNGTVTLNNNNITIKSDAVATANVGQMGGGAAFNYNGTGKFIVERYYPARRAWRLITAPVTPASGGNINSTWQEGTTKWPMGPATVASNPNDGYGTHISGGANADGYDQNVNGNPSIKIFSAGAWSGMPVATSLYTKKVTDEPGYMLFVRGSRAVDLTFGVWTVPNNTVLRTAGQLKVANVTPVTASGTGLRVLANPFASAINFNTLATQNGFSLGENKYYMWDPSLTGSYGVGAWVTLAYNGSTYDRTVSSLNDYTSSGGSQGIDNIGTIQSGAAVMYDFGAAPQTINLNESVKVDGSSNLLFRPGASSVRKQMRTNLMVERSGDTSLIDGVLVTYNPAYSNTADELDVNKLSNFSENFGLNREGRILAIERRKTISSTDTIFFNMAQMRHGTYMLSFEPDSMAQINLACYLEDSFLNTKTPVSLVAGSILPFTLTDDESAAKDRFRLVFKPWLRFINCNASVRNETALVKWNVMDENDMDRYEVERSTDGFNFYSAGVVSSRGSIIHEPYLYNDRNIGAGQYYYRIKAISLHGVIAYSPVSKVSIVKSCPSLSVFPNPVTGNNAYLVIDSKLPSGEYILTLLTVNKNVISNKKIFHKGGKGNYNFLSGARLIPGIYQLEIILPDRTKQTIKLIVK